MDEFFLPYQKAWILDNSRIKLMEKSRQIGMSWTCAYELVRRHCQSAQKYDSWVSSRDELQAKLDKTYDSLSAEAKSYLETLKEKYGDIHFFVADCSSDEEMNQYFAMGTKKYSCVISTDTLEKMATDEEIRAKYESIIDNADEQIEEMKEQIAKEVGEEKAEQVQFVGFSIDDNGVVNYCAKLKDSNDSYYEKLAQKRVEEKKEAKEAEKRDKEKELKEKQLEEQKELPKKDEFWIKADSKEGLIVAIKEALGIEEVRENDQEITMTKVIATE